MSTSDRVRPRREAAPWCERCRALCTPPSVPHATHSIDHCAGNASRRHSDDMSRAHSIDGMARAWGIAPDSYGIVECADRRDGEKRRVEKGGLQGPPDAGAAPDAGVRRPARAGRPRRRRRECSAEPEVRVADGDADAPTPGPGAACVVCGSHNAFNLSNSARVHLQLHTRRKYRASVGTCVSVL